MKKLGRILMLVLAGAVLLCLAVVGVSALSNLGLPTRLEETGRLSELDKARLVEVARLRKALGSDTWPGWGEARIPLLAYTEEWAFLVGYPDPPDGWTKVPNGPQRGGPWEAVPGDTLGGQVYYRQRLAPGVTPEAFTVRVGERWVASLMTRDRMQSSFYQEMRASLPGPVRAIFPYRLAWGLLMGETETYIGGFLHEAFHAYQGMAAPERLAEAETSMRFDGQYPWDDPASEAAWQAELEALYEAVLSPDDERAAERARRFLTLRDARRSQGSLALELADLERHREWEEGLAKYAELQIQRLAALDEGYTPYPNLRDDPDFKKYATRQRYWNGQLSEVRRTGNRSGDTRLYFSGFAQAVLLDRLLPEWKEQAFAPGVWLEDLLRQAAR
jgi:hypothetical protein